MSLPLNAIVWGWRANPCASSIAASSLVAGLITHEVWYVIPQFNALDTAGIQALRGGKPRRQRRKRAKV